MIKFFSPKKVNELRVDLHSHLIPGIDDGVKSIDESVKILRELSKIGIQKVVTTPHIAQEFYSNTPKIINEGLNEVRKAIEKEGIPLIIEAAAEYYIDSDFLRKVHDSTELLTFGDRNILVETPFINKPHFFEEAIFSLTSNGYKPVLAHPERYDFIQNDTDYLIKLKELGVLFQVTASSFMGYYSKAAKKVAEKMLQNKLIDFLGSDIHRMSHCETFIRFRQSNKYRKCLKLNLLNDQLLS